MKLWIAYLQSASRKQQLPPLLTYSDPRLVELSKIELELAAELNCSLAGPNEPNIPMQNIVKSNHGFCLHDHDTIVCWNIIYEYIYIYTINYIFNMEYSYIPSDI